MIGIYLLPCHICQFPKSIEDVALFDFREPEKLTLKDRVVQIQAHGLISFLVHRLIRASNCSKFVSSGEFSSDHEIASLSSA